jgi:hypothetical protein
MRIIASAVGFGCVDGAGCAGAVRGSNPAPAAAAATVDLRNVRRSIVPGDDMKT